MQAPKYFGWRSASDLLGWWNLYFIVKLVLFAMGLMGFHLVENLVFAALLAAMSPPRARRFRPWIGVPVAIALFYYDTWLPGISRVVATAGLLSSFSGAYLAELAGRFVNFKALGAVAAAAGVYVAARRAVRFDALVVVAMLALAFLIAPPTAIVDPTVAAARGKHDAGGAGAGSADAGKADAGKADARSPDAMLAEFFQREAMRSVAFARPPEASPAFDVIFLHVCSMSWDDLGATGMDKHPLLSSFDIVLRRFNSVSTYSGPAAIRFLRAPCGQPTHKGLYTPAREQCQLLPALQAAGFEQQLVLNHDGHFDDFLKFVKAQGVRDDPQPLAGLPAPLRSFDDSRIYDDAAILGRWLQERGKAGAPRAAVYYNSVTLHDGNRLVADPGKKSTEIYKPRLAKVLDDLDAFVKKLAASGRRAVVVLVPEHGAALRGDAAQIAGLREIPTPAITLVPVMVKVVGPDAKRTGQAAHVNEPTSYLALSHVVAQMLARPPFGANGFAAGDYVNGLPQTEFVSEGETATVIRRGQAYFIKQERDPWKELR